MDGRMGFRMFKQADAVGRGRACTMQPSSHRPADVPPPDAPACPAPCPADPAEPTPAPTPAAAPAAPSLPHVRDAQDQAIIDLANEEVRRDWAYHSRRRRRMALLSSWSYWLSLLLSVVSSVLAYVAGAQAGAASPSRTGALALTAGVLGTVSASLTGISGAAQYQSDKSTEQLSQMMRDAGDDDILRPLLAARADIPSNGGGSRE